MMYNNAKYLKIINRDENVSIRIDINGVTKFVPIDPDNTDYKSIMDLVEAGELTIEPADEPNT